MSESFDPNETDEKEKDNTKKKYWQCLECRSFYHCKIIKEMRMYCPNHKDVAFQTEKKQEYK